MKWLSIVSLAMNARAAQVMTDKVAALGGTITVKSEPGSGTTVTGRVPAKTLEGAAG